MLKFLFKPSCSCVEVVGYITSGIGWMVYNNLNYLWVIPVTAVICAIGESAIEEKK